MDTLSPAERSVRMGLVKNKNTKPELLVRRLVHQLGYRYRLHRNDLPGRPDLTFAARRKVIFVHGCFWHRHACVLGDRMPKSRRSFWCAKLESNRLRDRRSTSWLKSHGWSVLVVWECEVKDVTTVAMRIAEFLDA